MDDRVRVVIFGRFTNDWMTALSPTAPVWPQVAGVRQVWMVPDLSAWEKLPPDHGGLRTIVIPLLERHAKVCPRDYHALIPDNISLDVLGDKRAFAQYIKELGLEKYCPRTFEDINDAEFPCVLKRTNLLAGEGIVVATSHHHLQGLLATEPWQGHEFVLQSFVAGERDYVIHCVCKNGKILWHKTFSYLLREGEHIRTQHNVRDFQDFDVSDIILEQMAAIISPLSYNGPLNADFKISARGDIVVLEVNPRLGGSLMRSGNVAHLRDALSCIIANAVPSRHPPASQPF